MKEDAYRQLIKTRRKNFINEHMRYNHVDDYVYEWQGWCGIPNNRFCLTCFNVTKNEKCGVCGNETDYLDVRARPPKRTASKLRWLNFLRLFKPDVLKDSMWWNRRQKWLKR